MSGQELGGVLDIGPEDTQTALEVFDLMTPDFDGMIQMMVNDGTPLIEATITIRQLAMSQCMGKQLGLDTELITKFEATPAWCALINALIMVRDEARARHAEGGKA